MEDKKNKNKKTDEQKLKECECHECKCDEKTAEIEMWKNKYLRSMADYQNLENRIEKQFEDFKIKANKNLLLNFLDILDMLDHAEIFIKDNGLKMIKASFEKKLEMFGLKEIEVINKKFDPVTAECIDVVEGKNDDMVIKVLKRGFEINKEVLRVAQVTVERKTVAN